MTKRRERSYTMETPVKTIDVLPADNGLEVNAVDRLKDEAYKLRMTHWSFGRLARYARVPADYARELPAELAAINLNWGLQHRALREDALVLAQDYGRNKTGTLQAATSLKYGRIWDQEVVEAVQTVNPDGRWKIPAASYENANPKRATTLYASDRDVFIFLVDPDTPIEVKDETLFKGFYCWNSEVGAATFGLTTFLYRYVCDNRIIWGQSNVKELRIKHTSGAPDRFAAEGRSYLERYAQESTKATAQAIERAKRFELPNKRQDNTWESWLQGQGFTASLAKESVQTAEQEEGEAKSLWNIVNGVTAAARRIKHTDTRVKTETAAGKLMRFAE